MLSLIVHPFCKNYHLLARKIAFFMHFFCDFFKNSPHPDDPLRFFRKKLSLATVYRFFTLYFLSSGRLLPYKNPASDFFHPSAGDGSAQSGRIHLSPFSFVERLFSVFFHPFSNWVLARRRFHRPRFFCPRVSKDTNRRRRR